MSNNESTVRHFSRAAALYHSRAELQRAVAGRLLSYLSDPLDAGRILELGCGTGFLTERLLGHLEHARIDAVDISASMIEQARQAVVASPRVHWHVCDIWNYHAGEVYDLISSSSSLQWMQPLDALFSRLALMLKPEGRLLCAAHGGRNAREAAPPAAGDRPPESSARPTADGRLDNCVLARRGIPDLPFRTGDPANGTRQCRRFSATIRELGFTGGPLATSSRLLTRGELKRLAERYSVEGGLPGGKVGADYVIYYFEAFKEVRKTELLRQEACRARNSD